MIVKGRLDRYHGARLRDAMVGPSPAFAVLLCLIGSAAGCADAHSVGSAGHTQGMRLRGGSFADFGFWDDDVFFMILSWHRPRSFDSTALGLAGRVLQGHWIRNEVRVLDYHVVVDEESETATTATINGSVYDLSHGSIFFVDDKFKVVQVPLNYMGSEMDVGRDPFLDLLVRGLPNIPRDAESAKDDRKVATTEVKRTASPNRLRENAEAEEETGPEVE